MTDRAELKIKIRDVIWDLDSQATLTGHWEDPSTYADAVLAAIEEAGCAVVPIEPTDEMLKRILVATRDHGAPDTSGGAAYRAALHASPLRNTENDNG